MNKKKNLTLFNFSKEILKNVIIAMDCVHIFHDCKHLHEYIEQFIKVGNYDLGSDEVYQLFRKFFGVFPMCDFKMFMFDKGIATLIFETICIILKELKNDIEAILNNEAMTTLQKRKKTLSAINKLKTIDPCPFVIIEKVSQ